MATATKKPVKKVGTAATKTGAKASTKTSAKALTPLEKARLARAANKKGGVAAKKGTAKKKGARPGTFTFQAPTDFKPFFLEVAVRTDVDGLLGSTIRAIRYVGRYDPQAEDKKKFDISAYDVPTLVGLQSRLSTKTFKTNGQKLMPVSIKERNVTEKVQKADGGTRDKYTFGSGYRLPANTAFYLLLRIGKKSADNTLTAGLKFVQQGVRIEKNGVKKLVRKELEKKDPAYRMFGATRRYLPAAFKDVLLPPKRVRGANKKKDADEE